MYYEGRVKDESGNPLEFSNVTLQLLNDSTMIDGTVTDVTGKFVVTGNETPVFLKISAMGFEDKIIHNPEAEIGDIILTPA
ncbi:MAG: carboxypeptidase-like regulatory domain-containing protein, partial [Muribaculaceae bacterium]|nr:carboxypeptidase-like regulatory domain-containing protein [Muribaculaceae bacterium]